MKYIDTEKLKESLKRRYTDITVPMITSEGGLESYFRRREIRDIIKLIDFLQQEQPEVDLEKEIADYWTAAGWCKVMTLGKFKVIARYFYGLARQKYEK